MTILVCLGKTPDTWWQAKNAIGECVLSYAEALAGDDDVRKVIFEGRVFRTLALYDLEPALRERVWNVVEEAARAVSDAESEDWPAETSAHIADLAREMEVRRSEPRSAGRVALMGGGSTAPMCVSDTTGVRHRCCAAPERSRMSPGRTASETLLEEA